MTEPVRGGGKPFPPARKTAHVLLDTPQGPLDCIQAGTTANSSCTLVLLHGIQGTASIWQPVVTELGQNWGVIAPNLRGRAGSFSPSDPRDFTMSDFATDLAAVLQSVSGPILLAGWSMGSLVALEYLRTYGSDELVGLVLISGSPCLAATGGKDAVWFRGETAEAIAADAAGRKVRLNLTDTATDIAVAGSWLSAQRVDYRQMLSDITLPSLIVHGSDDPECPQSHGRLMAEMIPDARLVVWQGCGHVPMAHDANAMAKVLADFATECTA